MSRRSGRSSSSRRNPEILGRGIATGSHWSFAASRQRTGAGLALDCPVGHQPSRLPLAPASAFRANPRSQNSPTSLPQWVVLAKTAAGSSGIHRLLETVSRSSALAALPSVIGASQTDFASLQRRVRCEPVSRGNSPSYVEKPRFSAGVRAGASGAVGRDAQGAATSGQRAIISLSGHIPVPHRR